MLLFCCCCDQWGLNQYPLLQWKYGVLTTGLPENSINIRIHQQTAKCKGRMKKQSPLLVQTLTGCLTLCKSLNLWYFLSVNKGDSARWPQFPF